MVEKRVAGIILWLERLKKSYSSGAMESALMDAECARADLENLRQDVWDKLDPSAHRGSTILPRVLSLVRTLSLAAIIVVMSVVPLSREVPAPVSEPVRTQVAQAKPIIVIREYEPPKQEIKPETPAQTAQPSAKKQTSQKRASSKRTQAAPANTQPAAKSPAPQSTGTVPYDKVYSLIQTGQRALKNNSSVIKIK